MSHEKKISDVFSDLEDFFNFIDECIGDVCFVVEEKKDNDQSNSETLQILNKKRVLAVKKNSRYLFLKL